MMISGESKRIIEGAGFEQLRRMYSEGVLNPHSAYDRHPLTLEEQRLIHERLDAIHEREKARLPMAERHHALDPIQR